MPTPLLIVGAGGFALEAIWLAEAMNAAATADFQLTGLADDNVPAGESFGYLQVLGKPEEAARQLPEGAAFHVAIGDNQARLRIAASLTEQGLKPASLISPRAEVAAGAHLGQGVFIGHFATVAPEVKVGDYSLINVHAVVGHEAELGAGVQLCPGVIVTGRCSVGQGVLLGANAVLQPGVKVGDWARVSANTFAAADVEPGVTLAAMPGRPVFSRKNRERRRDA